MRDILDSYPLPQELVGEQPEPVRRRVIDYLRAGELCVCFCGTSWCRFGCEAPIGAYELTDGKWVWPEGLDHYVEVHGVVLPSEFVDHAMTAELPAGLAPVSPPPGSAPESFLDILRRPPRPPGRFELTPEQYKARVSDEWWVRWAADRQDPVLRAPLAAIRARLDAEAAERLEREIAELQPRRALRQRPCSVPGCTEIAAWIHPMCARHYLTRDEVSRWWGKYNLFFHRDEFLGREGGD
jgi:hypothetical protein